MWKCLLLSGSSTLPQGMEHLNGFKWELCLQLEASGACCPYKVEEVPGAGRGLVSTRDIAKNEHILTAYPAAMGPTARYQSEDEPECWHQLFISRSSMQCVNCFLLVSSPLACPQCSLVLCSMECSTGTLHQAECSLLASIRTRVGEDIWRQSLPSILTSVTTIRLLSLQWRWVLQHHHPHRAGYCRDPPTWDLVQSLINDKANESVWRIIKDAFDTVLHFVSDGQCTGWYLYILAVVGWQD